MNHHTHDKGDEGLAEVILDLTRAGFKVCLPLSTHLPFDLIAVSQEGRLFRLQVKYRTVSEEGILEVELTTSSINAHRKTRKTKHVDFEWLDGWAVYCPDTKQVYYVKTSELLNRSYLTLRVVPTKNNQKTGVRLASNYLHPTRLCDCPLENQQA